MALLGKIFYDQYEIRMVDDFENVLIEYVLATDVEDAAHQAYELSNRRSCTLTDVLLS